MNEHERLNIQKAIAVVTAFGATSATDPKLYRDVIMSYIREETVVLPGGHVDLGAVDLITGFSVLVTALLGEVERVTGVERAEILRDYAAKLS